MEQVATDIDYEKIIIYPPEMDIEKRRKLSRALKDLHVHYEYEQY